MSDAYAVCQEIGEAGVASILDRLEREYRGQAFRVTTPGFQKRGGDLVMAQNNGEALRIEVKTEELVSENIFFEDWSDLLRTPGWGATVTTDILAYYFQSTDLLYLFDWPLLQTWMRSAVSFSFRRRPQSKREQENYTTGYLVPISQIASYVGYVALNGMGERSIRRAGEQEGGPRLF